MKPIQIILVTFILMTWTAESFAQQDTLKPALGNPLYNPVYQVRPLDIGYHYQLSRENRVSLNLENSADLLWNNHWLYQPDFVTMGREVYLSPAMSGYNRTQLYWRNRPFRDPVTLQSDFSLIPVNWVGGVRSTAWGSVNGVTSAGGLVEFTPLTFMAGDTPATTLHHRVGFYDVQPVDFTHQRRLSEASGLSISGAFPASGGRFPHAEYSGYNLSGDYMAELDQNLQMNVSYSSGKHVKEIAYSDSVRHTHRNDLDVVLNRKLSEASKSTLGVYSNDQTVSFAGARSYGEEIGFHYRRSIEKHGLYVRFAHLNGTFPGGKLFRNSDMEALLTTSAELGRLSSQFGVGVNGWVDQLRPTILAGLGYSVNENYTPYLDLKHVSAVASPESRYANYLTKRTWNELEPVWLEHPELPIIGNDNDPNVIQGGNLGLRWKQAEHGIDVSIFITDETNPQAWQLDDIRTTNEAFTVDRSLLSSFNTDLLNDTIISLNPIDQRTIRGWQGSYRYDLYPFRGGLSAIWHKSDVLLNNGTVPEFREPQWRAQFEAAWHQVYYNGDFEVDISLSGRYFSSFFAYTYDFTDSSITREYDFRKMKHAYPLDVRFTGRIKSFTLYYGVHNWNSFQYYLVPGYKMIHKEEYLGIDWLLFN